MTTTRQDRIEQVMRDEIRAASRIRPRFGSGWTTLLMQQRARRYKAVAMVGYRGHELSPEERGIVDIEYVDDAARILSTYLQEADHGLREVHPSHYRSTVRAAARRLVQWYEAGMPTTRPWYRHDADTGAPDDCYDPRCTMCYPRGDGEDYGADTPILAKS